LLVHIFIDESGQFIPLDGAKSRAAATVGLVVPSSMQGALRRAFRKLKQQLGASGGEIKGAALAESEAAQVIALLRQYDVILEAVVVDAGEHSDRDITDFKVRQADRLFGHITREHQPTLIQDLITSQETMKALPNQLFLQVFCIWELIPRLLETATMYYAQRRPAELGSFVWRVDAKDASITAMENLWTSFIGPLIMEKSRTSPMGMIPGADYSFYERFDTAPVDGSATVPGHFYTDTKRVLRDDFAFTPSEDDLGLQMADICAAILTRALNGTLQPPGWQSLGSLFVRRKEQTVRLIALSWDGGLHSRDVTNPRWHAVVPMLEKVARPMLTRHTWQLVEDGGPS
jgi:uncharacterized protein DUF3800